MSKSFFIYSYQNHVGSFAYYLKGTKEGFVQSTIAMLGNYFCYILTFMLQLYIEKTCITVQFTIAMFGNYYCYILTLMLQLYIEKTCITIQCTIAMFGNYCYILKFNVTIIYWENMLYSLISNCNVWKPLLHSEIYVKIIYRENMLYSSIYNCNGN